jgi:hypothetical protein
VGVAEECGVVRTMGKAAAFAFFFAWTVLVVSGDLHHNTVYWMLVSLLAIETGVMGSATLYWIMGWDDER